MRMAARQIDDALKAGNVGRSSDPLYPVWIAMRRRCHYPQSPAYKDYGARGIAVHPEWREDFEAFRAYVAALPKQSPSHSTIDRIDNDRGYEPGNLRWATPADQARNKRNAIYVEHGGQMRRLYDLAAEAGISYKLAHKRWAKGMTAEGIMAPVHHGAPCTTFIEHQGSVHRLPAFAAKFGVRYPLAFKRHQRGWTAEEIIAGRRA